MNVLNKLEVIFINHESAIDLIVCVTKNEMPENIDSGMFVIINNKKNLFIEIKNEEAPAKIGYKIVENIKKYPNFIKFECKINRSDADILEIAEICALCYPDFQMYKKDDLKSDKQVSFIVQDKRAAEAEFSQNSLVVESALEAIRIVNTAPNHMRPSDLVREAKALQVFGVGCEVLEGKAIEKMECLVAVGKGSDDKSKLIITRYMQGGDAPTIALVGKGITFDTGGYSLKPANNMLEMHADMAGAAAVLGTIAAVARLKLKVNLVAVVAAAENMVDGLAMRPEDVYKSYSGKTVQILNTDAEGRLVLADAISYVQEQFKPKVIIDLATLTGAIIIALGKLRAGAYSNSDRLFDIIYKVGEKKHEKVWRMPLDQEYADCMKGAYTDLRNAYVGCSYDGGSATAAGFLSHFVDTKECDWVHLDIASTAYFAGKNPYYRIGATGFGVRLMTETIKELINDF